MIAALVNLAALDGGGHAEGVADGCRQRLRSIDDEQPGNARIEPPAGQVVEQGLHRRDVLSSERSPCPAPHKPSTSSAIRRSATNVIIWRRSSVSEAFSRRP